MKTVRFRHMADAVDEQVDLERRAARVVQVAFVCLSDNELRSFLMRAAGLNQFQQARALGTTQTYTQQLEKSTLRKLHERCAILDEYEARTSTALSRRFE